MDVGRGRRSVVALGLALGLLAGCSTQVAGHASAAADGATPDAATANPPAAGATASDPAAASPDAALPDACTLLTLPEATKVAGTPLDPGTPSGPDGSVTLCEFTGPTSGPLAQVEVYVGDGAKKILDIDKSLGHTITPVPGIGDEAYEEDGNIFVRKGGTWAGIRLVRLNDPAENRQPLRTAAAVVVGRL